MQTYVIPIQGMTCASCSGRIERALQSLDGVEQVQVNLATEQAHVVSRLSLAELVQTIEKAGYEVPTSTYSLSIEGMTCTSCSGRIENVARNLANVVSASVNLATEQAQVSILAGSDIDSVLQKITAAGYPARLSDDVDPDLNDQEAKRDRREKWAVIIALLLALPMVGPMLLHPFTGIEMPPAWVQWLLATPVQFVLGARFYRSAWGALKAFSGNMDQLVALGTSAAYGLSVYLWWQAPQGHEPHLYFEASAVVIALVLLGKFLERRAKRQTASALRALEALRPTTATRLEDDKEVEVPISALRVGDAVVVRPGERFAVDGLVAAGRSQADESLISGESLPVDKKEGDRITAGSINGSGRLVVTTQAVGQQTVLSHIIHMVEAAQAAKAPIQALVDKVSQVFVPSVLVIAAVTFIGWLMTGVGVEQALINAVSVLVIACPCALGLATPAAIMAGTGVAAKNGILIKDAQVLEQSRHIDAVLFDKTGTLTEGRLRLRHIQTADGISEADFLLIAATLQQGSEHPLALAVQEAQRERTNNPHPLLHLSESQGLAGLGIQGEIEGRTYFLGNTRLLESHGLSSQDFAELAKTWEAEGRTISWLIQQQPLQVLGLMAFGDTLKQGALEAVSALQAQGVEVQLITGDNAGSAQHVADQLGINVVHANVLPADKSRLLEAVRAKGYHIAMVGDGVNDAPALAAADIGMAMGSGTDVAMQAASITLMHSDPRWVGAALDIGRRTYQKIRQNLFWAFIYNVVGIPLAALGGLNPMMAGAAMALSSVCVLGNALLLNRWKPQAKELISEHQ